MTTIDDVLARQKTDNVLYPPTIDGPSTKSAKVDATASGGSLSIGLYNSTTSNNVHAYITGLAIDNSNCLFLLESDGQTPYYPTNPSSNGAALSSDCGILLGAPGTTRTVTIPYIAGGRIWFCVDSTLSFFLNPSTAGPGLVEPSVSNTSDPNYHLSWDFCEFTYNSSQLYANITYVDFVSIPISLTVTSTTGATSHVGGLPSNGLETICNGLKTQNDIDSAGWDQLIITNNGSNLRALSPSNGIIFNPSLFEHYWDSYIDAVWSKYVSSTLVIDSQFSWGTFNGCTSNDRTLLTFTGTGTVGSFPKPSSTDIFGANSGAFAAQATNTAELLNIGARLDAGFNRSTLLINSDQPNKEVVDTYYQNDITNHYARIVHAANVDGRGYCHPYDDVTPDGGVDQSGFVNDGSPANFLITVGGGNAYAKRDVRTEDSKTPRFMKRSLSWEEDVKVQPRREVDERRDLEKGEHSKLSNEREALSTSWSRNLKLPPQLERVVRPYVAKIQASSFYINRLRPLLELISQLLISLISISIRTIISRVFIVVFFILFYFLGLLPHGSVGEPHRRVLESSLAVGNGNGTIMLQGS